jgi:hypothetical protein
MTVRRLNVAKMVQLSTPAGKAPAMKAGRTGTSTDAGISLPAGLPQRVLAA